MKSIKPEEMNRLPGVPLKKTDTFNFRCHKGLACFNQCCRNLNLFLYPYDVLRLKKSLKMDSDRFLESHVDVVLRKGNYFPDVLLRMADNEYQTCPFLSDAGCTVYADRPDTCRTFPVEHGLLYNDRPGESQIVSFFRPPDFCQGQHDGAKGKMAFMAAYNIDRFRDFVFQSSFLKRYRIKRTLVKKIRISDRELLLFGFEWIRYFVWGIPSKNIRP